MRKIEKEVVRPMGMILYNAVVKETVKRILT